MSFNALLAKNLFYYDPVLPVPKNVPIDLLTVYLTDNENSAAEAKALGWQYVVVINASGESPSDRLKVICKINCFPEQFLPKELLEKIENVFVIDGNIIQIDSRYAEYVKKSCSSGKLLNITAGSYSGNRNTLQAELHASNQQRWKLWWNNMCERTEIYEKELKHLGYTAESISISSAKYIGWNLTKKKTDIDVAHRFLFEYSHHNQGNIILSFLALLYSNDVYVYTDFANDGQVIHHKKEFI